MRLWPKCLAGVSTSIVLLLVDHLDIVTSANCQWSGQLPCAL